MNWKQRYAAEHEDTNDSEFEEFWDDLQYKIERDREYVRHVREATCPPGQHSPDIRNYGRCSKCGEIPQWQNVDRSQWPDQVIAEGVCHWPDTRAARNKCLLCSPEKSSGQFTCPKCRLLLDNRLAVKDDSGNIISCTDCDM